MTPPTPSGSGERPTFRAVAPVPLIAAVLAAPAAGVAVALAPDSVRTPLAWGAGAAVLLLCTAIASAAHAVQTSRLMRRRLDSVTEDAGRLLQERARLASEFHQERTRLADESAREMARLREESAREMALLKEAYDQERAALTEEFTGEEDRLTAENAQLTRRVRQAVGDRAAAISATANAAARMQALSTGMLADLRAMEEKHSDEEVLADLLHLDHRTAQAGRLADSVAVLTGARSGRRWARPIVMESILRGAMGRIGGYQRVRVHSSSEAAVAGHAAEGVMHALAELLDNAANFSPPTAEVHVYVEEVPAGVIVSVEDSGLVMGDVQLRRAERAVSGDTGGAAELGGLSGTRLGLAVVGRLARKHGLKVSFRPSARGGTGVLVLIPQDILTRPNAPLPGEAETGSAPAVATVAEEHVDHPVESRPQSPESAASPQHPPVSYAAARAVGDLDPDPVPTHESPDRSGTAASRNEAKDAEDSQDAPETPGTGGLPKRRRGRTLAHAERSRGHATGQVSGQSAGQASGQAVREPRTAADDAKARIARFSSFRQAVRGASPDQATDRTGEQASPQETAPAEPATPSQPHQHPEGDTTP
ncbi:ATP-binding protein [Streptomyces sp. R21]|uniref:histidine kinase n=1 Tax=Streptomyces sp. R21 TaxID=3238627 RepID=A0AB39PDN6_9ACTN